MRTAVQRRRVWLSIHLYLGLVCAPYFVLYGVTAIAFNHGLAGAEHTRVVEQELPRAVLGGAPRERAARARDAIGIAGHAPPSAIRARDDGSLEFAVNRPGRRYVVQLAADGRGVRVQETRTSLLALLRGLHGATAIPGMGWTHLWALYTDVSSVALVAAAVSGIALFWPRRAKRRIAVLLTCAGVFALAALGSLVL